MLAAAIMPACLAVSIGMTGLASPVFYCTRPTEPFCIDSYGTFDDDWAFDRCRSEVERYLDAMGEYRRCLLRQVEIELDDAANEAQRVTERFNCKAGGGLIC